jgi:5'-deoxynucleotidase YfbR-like HD superfamily hydrolase
MWPWADMTHDALIKLFESVGRLKTLKRTGWIENAIPTPESVADHGFRVAFMAMIWGDLLGLDTEKLLKMSLLHDLGEVITGDITPSMGISIQAKQCREKSAVSQLLTDCTQSEDYLSLWCEFTKGATPEAFLLKNIDKFEMALQAFEYQKKYPDKDLSDFFASAKAQVTHEDVACVLDFLLDIADARK